MMFVVFLFLFSFFSHILTLTLLSFKKYQKTPLYVASEKGHEAIVKLLLEKGGDPNAKDDVCGFFCFCFLFSHTFSLSSFFLSKRMNGHHFMWPHSSDVKQ